MRTCAQCGQHLTPRRKEGPANFATRRYCSKACADASRRLPAGPPRPCAICRTAICRAEGESPSHFASRRYCSLACKHMGQRDRPSTSDRLDTYAELRAQGYTRAQIAERMGMRPKSLQKFLQRHRDDRRSDSHPDPLPVTHDTWPEIDDAEPVELAGGAWVRRGLVWKYEAAA